MISAGKRALKTFQTYIGHESLLFNSSMRLLYLIISESPQEQE